MTKMPNSAVYLCKYAKFCKHGSHGRLQAARPHLSACRCCCWATMRWLAGRMCRRWARFRRSRMSASAGTLCCAAPRAAGDTRCGISCMYDINTQPFDLASNQLHHVPASDAYAEVCMRARCVMHGTQVIARLGGLRALNGADVPPSERRDSELRYLRRVEGACDMPDAREPESQLPCPPLHRCASRSCDCKKLSAWPRCRSGYGIAWLP